ncbi:MAG: response regulator [Deltaproteobacteria bacterium]|nr:response regulator [Deltaproteobacteria bacterium]
MTAPLPALIVDDSPAARALARSALEAAADALGLSFEVEEAGSGMEALRALTAETQALVIVDLHMPDMTGLEVLSFWRKRGGGARAVIVSTDVSPRDREKALELGAHALLEKPVTVAALTEVLRGLEATG